MKNINYKYDRESFNITAMSESYDEDSGVSYNDFVKNYILPLNQNEANIASNIPLPLNMKKPIKNISNMKIRQPKIRSIFNEVPQFKKSLEYTKLNNTIHEENKANSLKSINILSAFKKERKNIEKKLNESLQAGDLINKIIVNK